MSQENDKGLEFVGIRNCRQLAEGENPEAVSCGLIHGSLKSDPQLGKISRGSFRIPIEETCPIKARIRGQEFELVNLMSYGRSGIGIMLQHKEAFSVGEELPAIQLSLDGKTLTLQGIVRHVSPNGGGNYLCGIEFTRLTREDDQTLKGFCDSCHAALFKTK